MNISDKIKKRAEENGVSLAWVAKKAELTKVGFYKMLDTNSFKTDTLEKIADILGVRMIFFFRDEINLETDLNQLEKQLQDSIDSKVKVDFSHFDKKTKPTKTSKKTINKENYLTNILVSIDLYNFYEDINNNVIEWEKETNLTKEQVLKNIKQLIGEINFRTNLFNSNQ